MSKVKNKKKTKLKKKFVPVKKELSLVPVRPEEKALIVVEPKVSEIAVVYKHEMFEKIAKKVSLAVIGTISVAYILMIMIAATSVFYITHLKNGLIQKGVFINGISVSDLKVGEAVNSVYSQLNENIPEYIVLKYKENEYKFYLESLQLEYDVESAVDEAYAIGRTQNVVKDLFDYAEVMSNNVDITTQITYNEEALNNLINQLNEQLPDKVQEYSYSVQDGKLVITRGKNGIELEQNQIKEMIVANLTERKFNEQIEIPIKETKPKDIDVEKIHEEVYKEPHDAYFTENPFEIHQEVIGVNFDVENVKNIINSSQNDESYTINLELTNPHIFVKDLNIYPDVLSTFNTHYVNNPNRTTNLILAASKINGTVVLPGETFSFNKIVGERTIGAGYKNAAIFVNGQVEDGLAGGICQISSTLYDAIVGANLEITERHNHSKLTSYLPGGKDATVVWGRYDFQFKNNRNYPVKLEMTVQNGLATATVYGIKSDEEYEISIESQYAGRAGIYAVYNAYKVYKQNGVEVKREFLARDLYK